MEPPPELLFHRRINPVETLPELWRHRHLIAILSRRDLLVRYKQTILGFAWSVIVPVFLMIVFTVFVRRAIHVETHNVPYPLFAFVGLIPWTFFSISVNQGGQSIINNASLLTKVYCPREVFPLSTITVAAFDSVISTGVLLVMFVITGFTPKVTSLWVPVLVLMQLCFTTGATLLVAGLMVFIRDLRQALPLLLQLGLFATPVAYSLPLSARWEHVYAWINPLAPLIDAYRRTILFGQAPRWDLLGRGAVTSLVVLVAGYLIFKRLETSFAETA